MKCLEACCDCTAKTRPPGSRLSSTKTQHSCSAFEETLDCSSMMARSQMRKQVATAFNKGYFSLHHQHHENTIKTIKPMCTDWNGCFNYNDYTMKTSCNLKTPHHCYLSHHSFRWCQKRDKSELHLQFLNIWFNYKLRNILKLFSKIFFRNLNQSSVSKIAVKDVLLYKKIIKNVNLKPEINLWLSITSLFNSQKGFI